MLYAIAHGHVPTYTAGQDDIVYLATTVEDVIAAQLRWVASDRNAVLQVARFTDELAALDGLIDWGLMRQTYWGNTLEDPDRRERRQAELLVHGGVPWRLIRLVGTKTPRVAESARSLMSRLAGPQPQVRVVPRCYF